MNKIELSPKDEVVFERLSNLGALGKRGLYIFQYLFLREDFRKLIRTIRETLNIPKEGLDRSNKEHVELIKQKFLDNGGFYGGELIIDTKIAIGMEASNLIDDYIEQAGVGLYIPNMDLADGFVKSLIKEYAVMNDFVGFFKGSFALATVETYGVGMRYDDRESVELRLSVPISAKKEEVKEYLDSFWNTFEFAREKILTTKDKVRFRPRPNFIRDIKILNKYIEIENLSVAQRKQRGIEYIEIGVKRELQGDGMKNIPDEGTIRSIVSRLKNEIKDKSAFWKEIEEEEAPTPPLNKEDLDFSKF